MVREQLQLAHGTHEPEEEDNTQGRQHAGKPWKLPSTGGGALHSGDAARAAAGHFTAHLPYVTLVLYLHPDSLQLVASCGLRWLACSVRAGSAACWCAEWESDGGFSAS